MDEVIKAHLESINKRLDIMQDTMDRRFQEWSDDRKDLADLKIEIKTTRAIAEEARNDTHEQTKKITNKIDEHLQPVPDMVADSVKDGLQKGLSRKSIVNRMMELVKQ